ncbi:hypothetical protein H4R21_007002, partial [Coemansia helicoidea]
MHAYRGSLVSPTSTDRQSTDDEDEVFFGPMTTVELKKLHKQRDMHRRNTHAVQPQREAGATAIQALWRGGLVRQRQQVQVQLHQGHRMAPGVQCTTPGASPLPVST